MSFEALRKLTPKQRAFLTNYLSNGQDATKAAISAGYSVSNARVSGHTILKSESVQNAYREMAQVLDANQMEMVNKYQDQFSEDIASIYEIQAFWTRLIRNKPDESGEYVKLEARIRASELLAKNMGMFIDKVEHSGKDGEALPSITLNFIKPDTHLIDDSRTING